jgi:hypothetical protein
MIKRAKLVAKLLLIVFAGAVMASAEAKGKVPIGSDQVAEAIRAAGVHVNSSQIELLSSVVASKANPKLKVVSLAPMDGNLVQARVRCENNSVCLPFYVLIHCEEGTEAKTAMASWEHATVSATHRLTKEETLVHTGKAATLLFEGNNMRMSLPVVALQNGARGQRVRVMSKDRKKIYVALVSGEAQVHAEWGN